MINWKYYYTNIPSEIKIGRNLYPILWTNGFPNDSKQLGESNFNESKSIIINMNQSIKETVHTLFHEMLHCISYEYDANLTENQVRKLEKALTNLINSGIITKEVKNHASNKRKRKHLKRSR